jgi:alpha-N-arabinofuranosidase
MSREGKMDRRRFFRNAGTGLAVAALVPEAAPARRDDKVSNRANIYIDYASPGHEIPRLIYGQFIEQLGMCIERGLWTANGINPDYFLGGIRPEVLEAVNSINPACIRWPGGCFADSYLWKDGIGPMQNRPIRPNRAWNTWGKAVGPDVTNQFGTDEFCQFCEQVRAEPMITANAGSAPPDDAAAWIEYCNRGTEAPWGQERARNGREKPYKVKYWFVGNEMWNSFEFGHCTAEEYAKRFVEYAKIMRKADPDVKLIACGIGQPTNDWNRAVLTGAGQDMDYLSIHAYYPGKLFAAIGPARLKQHLSYYSPLEGVPVFEEHLDRSWEAIEKWGPAGREIRITFDEWNLWYVFWDVIRANYNLRDGLFVAAMLNGLQRRADRIPIANIAQMINCIGIIFVDEKGVFLTPSAWVFKMYTENAGQIYVSAKTDCDRIIGKEADIPVLNVSSSRDRAGKILNLFVVNQHRTEDISTEIKLAGFNPETQAHVHELSHPDPLRFNNLRKPEAVVPSMNSVRLALKDTDSAKSFRYSFPPHSVTVMVLKQA